MKKKMREKTLRGIPHVKFEDLFKEYLKKSNMTIEEFAEEYSKYCQAEDNLKNEKWSNIDKDDKDWAVIFCDMTRDVPLRAIKVLTDKLDDDAEEAIGKLLYSWFNVFGHRRKRPMDIFQFVTTTELAWMDKNMSILLSLSDAVIEFQEEMFKLNNSGLLELYEGILRICDELDIDLSGIGDLFLEFENVSVNKDYRTTLHYLCEMEKNQEIWKIKDKKRREKLVTGWRGLLWLCGKQEDLINIFIHFESENRKISFEQQIFLRKLRVLLEDDRYVNTMYKRGCK